MQLSQLYQKKNDKVGIQLRFLASQVSGLMHDAKQLSLDSAMSNISR